MFQLTREETRGLMSHTVTSIGSRGGRRYAPYAFTEQGVAMLSIVLRSPRAIHVNIEIMRTFVRLRALLAANVQLARRLQKLEKKTDTRFKIVFNAIHGLMALPSEKPKRRIGFCRVIAQPVKTNTRAPDQAALSRWSPLGLVRPGDLANAT